MAAGSTRTWKDAQRVRGYNRVEGKRENQKTGRASEKIFKRLATGRENSIKDKHIVPGINVDVLL